MNNRKHARLRKIQKRRQLETRVRRLFGYLVPAFEKEIEERITNVMYYGTTHPEHYENTASNVVNDHRPDLTVEAIAKTMNRFKDPSEWFIP